MNAVIHERDQHDEQAKIAAPESGKAINQGTEQRTEEQKMLDMEIIKKSVQKHKKLLVKLAK